MGYGKEGYISSVTKKAQAAEQMSLVQVGQEAIAARKFERFEKEINSLTEKMERIENILNKLGSIDEISTDIEKKRYLINEIEKIYKRIKETDMEIGRYHSEVKGKWDEAITTSKNILEMRKNLEKSEKDIQQAKELADIYQKIKDYPPQIKDYYEEINAIYKNVLSSNEELISQRSQLTEKIVSLAKEVLLKQRLFKQIEIDISGIKTKVEQDYTEVGAKKKKIIEECTSASNMKNKVQGWLKEIEPLVDKTKSTLKERGIEAIKACYEELEQKAYNEFIQKVSLVTSSSTTSSEIVEKMRHALSKIRPLITILQNKPEYNEILKSVIDLDESLSRRLQSFTGQIEKPKIGKEIISYDEYKGIREKEIIDVLLSGKDIDDFPMDIERDYQEFVEAKYKKYLKEFIKRLESQRIKITDLAKNRQMEYKEFIGKDLMNLFVNAIDRIKSKDDKKIPQEVNKSLNDIFEIIGIEEIPITIGVTKIDASTQHIQGFKTGNYEDGTVAEVVCRGFKYKETNEIIRKPVVIRGEKG